MNLKNKQNKAQYLSKHSINIDKTWSNATMYFEAFKILILLHCCFAQSTGAVEYNDCISAER